MKTVHATQTCAAEDQQLVDLVEEITSRLQAGQPCDVEQYAARFPEYADRLRQWVSVMSAMADLGHSLQPEVGSSASATASWSEFDSASVPGNAKSNAQITGVLGDFRILRELGRGGMGVVYEAEQISLGRRVALKVLPFAAMLDKQQLARFKNEARAAATLDHPNIVAIHSVGAERGVHYYAMHLVEGRSLAEIIAAMKPGRPPSVEDTASNAVLVKDPAADDTAKAALPTVRTKDSAAFSSIPAIDSREYYRAVARLGIQAAEALDHAHQNGILHRDIKPANLLIELSGAGAPSSIQHPASSIQHLKLWITDFGLARMEQDAGMTMTGDILGTLRYMSPEQALAKRVVVDHRSDIYSLGVTLYELLTLQPAYTGDDRQELLRQIAFDEPRKPRQLNTHIPQDLETIVLKAIEKNPADRYATAQALADDLHCHLESMPIMAKPVTNLQRARKWARRHPAFLWSAASVVLVATLLSIASSLLLAQAYTKESRARHSAELERAQAERERRRAEEHFRTARAAVDRMFTKVAEDLHGVPHMEEIRRALLDDGLDFYQGFLKEKSTDPDVRHETARAHMRIGNIQLLLGQLGQVEAPLYKAIKLLEKLSGEFPSVPEYRSDLANSHAGLSNVLSEHLLNRPEESLEQAHAALVIKRRLAAEFPNRPGFRRGVAEYLTTVAICLSRGAGRPAESEVYFREALESWEAIQKETPDDPEVLLGIASARFWLGAMFLNTKRLPEAEAEIRPALAVREELITRRPNDLSLRDEIAYSRATLASVLVRTGRSAEAEPLLREVIAYRQEQLDDFPNVYEIWRRLGIEYKSLGDCLLAMGRKEEAEETIRQSLSHWQKVSDEFTSENQTSINLAWSYYALGLLLNASDRPQDASDAFRQAFGLAEKVTSEHPELASYDKYRLGWMLATCPATQFRDPNLAIELAKLNLQHQPGLWDNWHLLGVAQYRAGKSAEAIDSLQKCIALCNGGDSAQWYFLAMAHWRSGNADKARDWYQRAVNWMQKNQPNNFELRSFRAEAEELMGFGQENHNDTKDTEPQPRRGSTP